MPVADQGSNPVHLNYIIDLHIDKAHLAILTSTRGKPLTHAFSHGHTHTIHMHI